MTADQKKKTENSLSVVLNVYKKLEIESRAGRHTKLISLTVFRLSGDKNHILNYFNCVGGHKTNL